MLAACGWHSGSFFSLVTLFSTPIPLRITRRACLSWLCIKYPLILANAICVKGKSCPTTTKKGASGTWNCSTACTERHDTPRQPPAAQVPDRRAKVPEKVADRRKNVVFPVTMLGRPALYRIEKIVHMTICCQGHADGYDDGEKGGLTGFRQGSCKP